MNIESVWSVYKLNLNWLRYNIINLYFGMFINRASNIVKRTIAHRSLLMNNCVGQYSSGFCRPSPYGHYASAVRRFSTSDNRGPNSRTSGGAHEKMAEEGQSN